MSDYYSELDDNENLSCDFEPYDCGDIIDSYNSESNSEQNDKTYSNDNRSSNNDNDLENINNNRDSKSFENDEKSYGEHESSGNSNNDIKNNKKYKAYYQKINT